MESPLIFGHGSFNTSGCSHTAQSLGSSQSLELACWYSLENCNVEWRALGERPMFNLLRTVPA